MIIFVEKEQGSYVKVVGMYLKPGCQVSIDNIAASSLDPFKNIYIKNNSNRSVYLGSILKDGKK